MKRGGVEATVTLRLRPLPGKSYCVSRNPGMDAPQPLTAGVPPEGGTKSFSLYPTFPSNKKPIDKQVWKFAKYVYSFLSPGV